MSDMEELQLKWRGQLNGGFRTSALRSGRSGIHSGPTVGVSRHGAAGNLFLPTPSGPTPDYRLLVRGLHQQTFRAG